MTTLQDASQLQLDRLRRAWRGSALPGFLRWWGSELAAFVPVRWREAFSGGERWYAIERTEGGWRLRRAGEAFPLAEVADTDAVEERAAVLARALQEADPADRRIALLLPGAQVMRRRLVLPLAARDNLRQVVGYDLDRQTPFQAEDIHYGVREFGEGGPEGRFVAELAATPRTILDPLLDALAGLGVSPDRVDVAQGNALSGVDLLPPARAPRRVDRRRRLNAALVTAIVLLVFATMAAWLHNRNVALETMRADVEAMQGDAQRVKALRQRLTDSAGASGFLARKKIETASVLPVLEELTRRLPDDTWLERFTLNASGQLGFQGQSPQAARLIDALKGARTIGEPSFQGTIQADPTSGKERFYMQAKALVPKPEATPPRGAVAPARAASAAAAAGAPSGAPVSVPASAPSRAGTASAKPVAIDGKEATHANETR